MAACSCCVWTKSSGKRSEPTIPTFTIILMPVTLQPLPSLPSSTLFRSRHGFALYKHSGHDTLFDSDSRQRARPIV